MTPQPRGARIVSTGSYLPGEPISNEDIERLVGAVPPALLDGIRMKNRHWVVDPVSGEHHDSTSGMATKAIQQALERGGVQPEQLDLIVVATASPDYMLPPTVAIVQEKLGLARCATLELRSGGAGVVQGMDIARLYIEREIVRTAVVVGCDSISPIQAQYLLGGPRLRTRERLLMYMFGDGAGAVLMQASDESTVIGAAHGCIGTGHPPGMQVLGGGGTYEPYVRQLARNNARIELIVDMDEASTITATLTIEALRDLLAKTGLTVPQIDHCVTPEADTEWMARAFAVDGIPAEWSTIASKVRNALPEVGAPGSAALPIGLDRAWASGTLQPGDCVALLARETTKWIYATMAVTWTVPPPVIARADPSVAS